MKKNTVKYIIQEKNLIWGIYRTHIFEKKKTDVSVKNRKRLQQKDTSQNGTFKSAMPYMVLLLICDHRDEQ